MKIIKIDSYRDGGTIKIITDEIDYCIDNRISSTTKGSIYCGYPEDDNSNLDQYQDEMKEILIKALTEYTPSSNDFNWIPRINELLNI